MSIWFYPGSTDSLASGSCLTMQHLAWVPSHGVDAVAHAYFRDVSYISQDFEAVSLIS